MKHGLGIPPRGHLEQLCGRLSFDALKSVKKFTDRKAAVAPIWAACCARRTSRRKPRPGPPSHSAQKGAEERSDKKAQVASMMKFAKGATPVEIMQATGSQAHTVRGFVSILGSKGGEKIESSKNAAGERTFRIAK